MTHYRYSVIFLNKVLSSLTDHATKVRRDRGSDYPVCQYPSVHPMTPSIWLINNATKGEMKGRWFVAGRVGLKTGSLAPLVFISPGETRKTLEWKNDRRSAGSLDFGSQQPSDLPAVFPFRSRERPPILRTPLSPLPFPARFLSLPMPGNSQTQGLLSHRWLQPVLRHPNLETQTRAQG